LISKIWDKILKSFKSIY